MQPKSSERAGGILAAKKKGPTNFVAGEARVRPLACDLPSAMNSLTVLNGELALTSRTSGPMTVMLTGLISLRGS